MLEIVNFEIVRGLVPSRRGTLFARQWYTCRWRSLGLRRNFRRMEDQSHRTAVPQKTHCVHLAFNEGQIVLAAHRTLAVLWGRGEPVGGD